MLLHLLYLIIIGIPHLCLLLNHFFDVLFLDDVALVHLLEHRECPCSQEVEHSRALRLQERMDQPRQVETLYVADHISH